jgi:hypothetical protein
MSQDAKRASLMMALEAAGVRIEDLLQDAMLRQRALNEFDEAQDAKEQAFEEAKEAENRAIQAEIERITAHYMARIQANIDEVASRQDHLRNWQKRKQQEAQRIAAAAALCVPKNGDAATGSYTAVLARCGVEGSANGVR